MNKFCELVAPALATYSDLTGLGDPTLDQSVVADLIADLRHWCDYRDWSFEQLDSQGYKHYIAELAEQ